MRGFVQAVCPEGLHCRPTLAVAPLSLNWSHARRYRLINYTFVCVTVSRVCAALGTPESLLEADCHTQPTHQVA